MFKNIKVRKHEKAILFQCDEPYKILGPGEYNYFDPLLQLKHFSYSLNTHIEYEDPWVEIICKKFPELVDEHFYVLDLSDYQVALVYKDKRIINILPPSTKKLFWKGFSEINFEIIDLKENYEFPILEKQNIMSVLNLSSRLSVEQITEHELGLLYINGQFIKPLKAGIYAFWKFYNVVSVKRFDLRTQNLEVSGQEILTKDKVSLRINLSANYSITDPVKLTQCFANHSEHLYKELQFSLREVVGTKTLEELLSEKDSLNSNIHESLKASLSECGLKLEKVGIKDIILPGEMKDLLNKVVEAEKAAQANLIKRREETAATRSLLNTAKLMEDNPTLMRLKELEALEKITDKVSNISVYDGLNGLLNGLVKIKS